MPPLVTRDIKVEREKERYEERDTHTFSKKPEYLEGRTKTAQNDKKIQTTYTTTEQ